jgi:hypothetical protein
MNMILNTQKTLAKRLSVQGTIDHHTMQKMGPHGKNDNQDAPTPSGTMLSDKAQCSPDGSSANAKFQGA